MWLKALAGFANYHQTSLRLSSYISYSGSPNFTTRWCFTTVQHSTPHFDLPFMICDRRCVWTTVRQDFQLEGLNFLWLYKSPLFVNHAPGVRVGCCKQWPQAVPHTAPTAALHGNSLNFAFAIIHSEPSGVLLSPWNTHPGTFAIWALGVTIREYTLAGLHFLVLGTSHWLPAVHV